MAARARIRVTGTVQGVGFRPTVWRLAERLGLTGEVHNDGLGVSILLYPAAAAEGFVTALTQALPSLAHIESVTCQREEGGEAPSAFTIAPSVGGRVATQIVPDAAICPACRAEIRDPAQPRYRYPFTNCTHCGPRFSILQRLPYDRAATSMAGFPLCPTCQAQYGDPADRRFHAQPIACPACGPVLRLYQGGGRSARLRRRCNRRSPG